MLITFITLGKFLESSAKRKASSAISALLTLQPPTALQLKACTDLDDAPTEVAAASLCRYDVVKILPGAQVRTQRDRYSFSVLKLKLDHAAPLSRPHPAPHRPYPIPGPTQPPPCPSGPWTPLQSRRRLLDHRRCRSTGSSSQAPLQ